MSVPSLTAHKRQMPALRVLTDACMLHLRLSVQAKDAERERTKELLQAREENKRLSTQVKRLERRE
jgi:hypothetical protein